MRGLIVLWEYLFIQIVFEGPWGRVVISNIFYGGEGVVREGGRAE